MSLDKLKQQSDAHAAVASGNDVSSEAIQAAKDAYTPAFRCFIAAVWSRR